MTNLYEELFSFFNSNSEPRVSINSSRVDTSERLGIFLIITLSLVNKEAITMGREAFLDPEIFISPSKKFPPLI